MCKCLVMSFVIVFGCDWVYSVFVCVFFVRVFVCVSKCGCTCERICVSENFLSLCVYLLCQFLSVSCTCVHEIGS